MVDAQESSQEPPPSPRLVVNVVLFALAVLFAVAWYEIHIKVFATAVIIGSSVSVAWAVTTFIEPVKKYLGKWWSSWFDRFLKTKAATIVFAAGLAIDAFVLLTTSSARIVTDKTPEPGSPFTIEVQTLKGDRVVNKQAIVLTHDHTSDQLPFFFTFRTLQLRAVPLSPPIYDPPQDAFIRPGWIKEIRTMADSDRKKVHLVRVFPGKSLFQRLHDTPNPLYRLEVIRGNERLAKVDAMSFEALWIGAPQQELTYYQTSFESDQSAKSAMQADFDGYLGRPGNADPSGIAKQRWGKRSDVVDTLKPLAAGDVVRVFRGPAFSDTPIPLSNAAVTNVFVEAPQ